MNHDNPVSGRTWPDPSDWNDVRVEWISETERSRKFYEELKAKYEKTPITYLTTYQAEYRSPNELFNQIRGLNVKSAQDVQAPIEPDSVYQGQNEAPQYSFEEPAISYNQVEQEELQRPMTAPARRGSRNNLGRASSGKAQFSYEYSPTVQSIGYVDTAEALHRDVPIACELERRKAKEDRNATERRLEDKIRDTVNTRSEQRDEGLEVRKEISQIEVQLNLVKNKLLEIEGPIKINRDCARLRKQVKSNIGLDPNYTDQADAEIQNEYEILIMYRERMAHIKSVLTEKLQACKKMFQELDLDCWKKTQSLEIDRYCHSVTSDQAQINMELGSSGKSGSMNQQVLSPVQWQAQVEQRILRSKRLRSDAAEIRIKAEQLLTSSGRDIARQYARVNEELNNKVNLNQKRKEKITFEYKKTCNRINELVSDQDLLNRTIQSRLAPSALAYERLSSRAARPDSELINDDANELVRIEYKNLNRSVANLQQKLFNVNKTLSNLRESKTLLEGDLAKASRAMFIDRDQCLALRQRFPVFYRIGSRNL